MEHYSVAPRKVVHEFIETVDFDSVLIIMHDSHTAELRNWWHFSGHRNDYGTKELSYMAQQMASYTVEELKKDANSGERTIVSKRKLIEIKPKVEKIKDERILLFWGRIGSFEFSILLIVDGFGLYADWRKPGFSLILGPLQFFFKVGT